MAKDLLEVVSTMNLVRTLRNIWLKYFTFYVLSILMAPNSLYKDIVVFFSLNFLIKTLSKLSQLVIDLGGRLKYHVKSLPENV
jgi:hypothetical protein